jgi:phage/plasmid-like protein (TIGR03299 family)
MSHEIDTSTGQAAVFVTREPAWHRLGTVVQEAQTSDEAIRLACQDWQVESTPLWYVPPAQAQAVMVRGWVANVRNDTGAVLGVVTDAYKPFQNRQAFDFFDALVGEKLAIYETAGCLFGGRKVWIMARLPKTLRAGKDDEVLPYTLLSNSHDGTECVRMFPTTVRVVCANTLRLANSERRGSAVQGFSVRHRANIAQRVEEAREKLGIILGRMDKHQEEITALVGKKLDVQESLDYFKQFFPVEVRPKSVLPNIGTDGAALLGQILDGHQQEQDVVAELLQGHYAETERQAQRNIEILFQVLQNYENQGNSPADVRHSAWTAYNAVSEYADHQLRYRGDPQTRADRQLDSIWWGRADELKQQAYRGALDLVS